MEKQRSNSKEYKIYRRKNQQKILGLYQEPITNNHKLTNNHYELIESILEIKYTAKKVLDLSSKTDIRKINKKQDKINFAKS